MMDRIAGKPAAGRSGPPGSAVEARRLERRIRRYLMLGFLAVMLGPLLVGLLVMFGPSFFGSVLLWPLSLLAGAFSLGLPLLVAGIFVVGFGAFLRAYYRAPRVETSPGPAPGRLSAEIAMLEELRGELAARARRRVLLFVPLGLAIALALFLTTGGGIRSATSVLGLVTLVTIGALLGWLLAIGAPSAAYAGAFKAKLLPGLLAAHGDLRLAAPTKPPLDRLRQLGLLPWHNVVDVDDVVEGRYRECRLRITELELKGNRSLVFRGVLVDIAVDSPFRGVTVIADKGERGQGHGLARIRLEDPRFDEIYSVYATDEIEARAVLTPAVMERLLIIADGKSFMPPRFCIEAGRMSFALESAGGHGLFEPPGLETHDAGEQLASLQADLAGILALADAMIAMHASIRPAGAADGALPEGWKP